MAKFPEHVVERDLAGRKWVRRGRVGHFVLYRAEDVLAYMESKKAEQVERMLERG